MKTVSFSKRVKNLNQKSVSSKRPDAVSLNCEIQDREKLCASIGYALVQSPPFQHGSLRLYCGVPARHLLPQNAPPLYDYLDFVICRGQDAVLAVKVGEAGPPSCELRKAFSNPPTQKFLFYVENGKRGSYNTQKIVDKITRRLLEADSAGVRVSFCPIPSKLLKSLADPSNCVLKAHTMPKESMRLWFPTKYGRSLGILQGFRTDENNRVRPFLGCARECLDGLQETASWGEPGIPELPQEPLDFAQRVNLASRGMILHPEPVMDLLRQLGDMPLTEYFCNHPEELRAFQNTLPDAHTYWQAAACLTEFRTAHGTPMTFLLRAFVRPFLERADIPLADKPLRSVLFAASILAKCRYITWHGEMLFHDHDKSHIAETWTCRQWLVWVDRELEKSQEDPGKDLTELYAIIDFIIAFPFFEIHRQLNSNCA